MTLQQRWQGWDPLERAVLAILVLCGPAGWALLLIGWIGSLS